MSHRLRTGQLAQELEHALGVEDLAGDRARTVTELEGRSLTATQEK
jgi:hypothetical protein